MAYYAAITAGNWSTATNWVTSSVGTGSIVSWVTASTSPQSSDYVFLNNKIITLDAAATTINVTQINTILSASNLILSPGPNVAAGGSLTATQTTHIITASSGIYQGSNATNLINTVANGTINITASTFDCSAQQQGNYGVNASTSTSTVNIIVDTFKTGISTTGPIIRADGNTVNINLKGNTTVSTAPLFTHGGTNPTLTITGSVTVTSTTNAITTTTGTPITISGSITCNSSGIGINHSGIGPITVIGNVTAGTGAPGIVSTSTALVTVNGNIINNGPIMGVVAQRLFVPSTSQISIQNTDGITNTWQSQGAVTYTGLPSVNDVRSGVSYNGGSSTGTVVIPPNASDVRFGVPFNTQSLAGSYPSGTMIVPNPNDVRYGVLVNTGSATGSMYVPLTSQVKQGVSVNTGSATGSYVGPSDIWSYPTSSLTAGVGKLIKDNLDVNVGSVSSSVMFELNKSGSQYAVVTRLQNASTVGTTGDQISSFNT
jgi:hypothetical protein